jgi:hypothetical protein
MRATIASVDQSLLLLYYTTSPNVNTLLNRALMPLLGEANPQYEFTQLQLVTAI